MKLLSAIILSLVFAQCSKSKTENPAFLRLQQCGKYVYNAEATQLCFDKVVSDSRCPANAMCIWAGTAVAEFSFHKGNETHKLTLATNPVPGQYSKDTIVAGYKIEFVNLHPYPGTYTDNSPNNSKAEVKVTRL